MRKSVSGRWWISLLLPSLLAVGKALADEAVMHCRSGPWGDLEYTRIVIELPDELMAADYRAIAMLVKQRHLLNDRHLLQISTVGRWFGRA